MKFIPRLTTIALSLMLSAPALAKTPIPEILGTWNFDEIVYRGQRMDPPNPALKISITFTEVGLSYLRYWREGQNGFCQRRAIFWYDERTRYLVQTVVETDAANRLDCGTDPDMRVGTTTWTPITVVDDEMSWLLPLGDETIQYLWHRQAPQPNQAPRLTPRLTPRILPPSH